jgi:hypothetical protein
VKIADPDVQFENILADIFRKPGWRVQRAVRIGDMQADLIIHAGGNASGKKHVIVLKVASEGRRDRLIPLLSQAILEASAVARRLPKPAVPVAVVAAGRIPVSVAEHLKQFAERHAPDAGIGIIDGEGFRSFAGPGLEGLDAKPSRRVARQVHSPQRPPDLFSDLNQWMLKILLGQRLPEPLISIPRKQIRNASQLADAANVSVMSASRLVNQLVDRGFLDEGAEHLQIVRVGELLSLWISANREAASEIPARWILKRGPHQLQSTLREYASMRDLKAAAKRSGVLPRCCLGFFAAAEALGLGFVHGVPPHIYLERLTADSLDRLGLGVDDATRPVDIYLRVPVNREAIFRASVSRDGIAAADVLQVWLDVSTHPARGREQAREIQRRVLQPLFGKRG